MTRWVLAVLLIARVAAAETNAPQPQTQYTHDWRFPVWLTWTLVGAGVATAGVGGLFMIDASNRMDDYDQRVASACAVNGCDFNDGSPLSAELNDMRESAQTRNVVGIVTVSAGIAVFVTGAALVLLNKPVNHRAIIHVAPTSDGAAASATWRF